MQEVQTAASVNTQSYSDLPEYSEMVLRNNAINYKKNLELYMLDFF